MINYLYGRLLALFYKLALNHRANYSSTSITKRQLSRQTQFVSITKQKVIEAANQWVLGYRNVCLSKRAICCFDKQTFGYRGTTVLLIITIVKSIKY